MKFLNKLSKKPMIFQRTFGLNMNQARLLAEKMQKSWNDAEKARLNRKNRRRKIGGGRRYKTISLFKMVLIVLMYYKTNATQELIGFIWDIDQSAVSRLISRIMPLMEAAADPDLRTFLAKAKEDILNKRINSFEELIKLYPDLRDVSTDATEQQCYRSSNYEKQKDDYSGKSKQHAKKTQISVSCTGRILDVSESYPGSMHDKTVIEKEKTVEKFDKCVPQRFDSGYQGIQKDHPNHYLITPFKKPRKKDLPKLLKEHNKYNSKRRVIAEHVFSRIKKFKAFANVFRQPIKKYNPAFRAIAALVNFRLQNSMLAA